LYVYQFSGNSIDSKQKVNAFFTNMGNRIKISLGHYDRSKPLIIDPLTLIKTNKITQSPLYSYSPLWSFDLNSDGDIIFCGWTADIDFPKTYGSFSGNSDTYVGKFITSTRSYDWITIFGGSGNDPGFDLALDINKIYITGGTRSNDFPTTTNAYMINYPINIHQTTYLTILSLNGQNIEYSTFIGNKFYHWGTKIKISNSGEIYLAGELNGDQNPAFFELGEITTQQRNLTTEPIGYIMCFTPDQSSDYILKFSSLWGGDKYTQIKDIDVDNDDFIYITGVTKSSSSSFSPTVGAYDVINSYDYPTFFVTKLHFENNNLVIDYNSFFGIIDDYQVDETQFWSKVNPIIFREGKIIFAGWVIRSGAIPTVNAFNNTRGLGTQAFIAVIQPFSDGINDLLYSSYFGDCSELGYFSVIRALEYDINCHSIIFAGSTNEELSAYTGVLNEIFTPNKINGLLGTVYINKFTVQTLEELAYNAEGTTYFTEVKHNPATNILYVTGESRVTINQQERYIEFIKEFTKMSCYNEGDCPCPSSSKDWLTVTVEKGGDGCDADECLVTHRLAIPEEYACFGYVQVSTLIEGEVVSQPNNYDLSTFNMSDFNLCIKEGTNYTITVKLFKTCCDYNPCIIKKTVYCDVVEEAPPCTPVGDCEHIGWTKQEKLRIQVTDCPGCYLNVSYYTREACGFKDIQITKIEIEHGLTVLACCVLNPSQAFLEAVQGVIHENKMRFSPIDYNEPCSDTWRVSNASCWAMWTEAVDIGGPAFKVIKIQKPCFSNCCTRRLRVCRELPNKTKITDLGPGTPPFNCNGVTYTTPTQTLQCEYLCESLEDIDITIGKSGNFDDTILDEDPLYHKPFEQSKKAQFNISNDNEILRVLVDNSNANSLIINIFDINGKLLFSESNNIKSGLNAFDVDITTFNNGVYLYNIMIDDFTVQADKFMISR
jgi:hypothetical protein